MTIINTAHQIQITNGQAWPTLNIMIAENDRGAWVAAISYSVGMGGASTTRNEHPSADAAMLDACEDMLRHCDAYARHNPREFVMKRIEQIRLECNRAINRITSRVDDLPLFKPQAKSKRRRAA